MRIKPQLPTGDLMSLASHGTLIRRTGALNQIPCDGL